MEHSHISKSITNLPSRGFDKEDPASTEARVAKEMLLSTSISHPNVVQTYQICTIRVGTVLDSGFPGTDYTEVSPLAGKSSEVHKFSCLQSFIWLQSRLALPEGTPPHSAWKAGHCMACSSPSGHPC